MSVQQIDHIEQANDLIVEQYKTSVRLKAYIDAFMAQGNEIEVALFQLLNERNIDNAVGEQLDVIGRIVGLGRILVDAEDLKFLTFTDLNSPISDIERAWGDVDDPEVGGVWRDINQRPTGNVRLSDEQYRLFLRAKILKNHTSCLFPELIAFYKELFGQDVLIEIRESPGAFFVNIGKYLNSTEELIFKVKDELGRFLVPKPLGILMNVYEFDPETVFAYDAPPGLGYDEGKFIGKIL